MVEISVDPIDRVLSALDELSDDHPGLESAVDFYEEVLPLLAHAQPALHGLALDVEAARAKLAQGVPLLWGEPPGLAPNVDLFLTLCRLSAENGNEGAAALMRAFLEGDVDLGPLLRLALGQEHGRLAAAAQQWQLAPEALAALLRFLLAPITRAYAAAFAQLFDYQQWRRGYCPVCGDWPVLGQLQGRDKVRTLACGRCGTAWRHARLRCVWCGNTEKEDLGYLYDPDRPRLRADICDRCHGYVKTITTFDPLQPEMLLVHDLETLALDQMAAAQGYRRPRRHPLADA